MFKHIRKWFKSGTQKPLTETRRTETPRPETPQIETPGPHGVQFSDVTQSHDSPCSGYAYEGKLTVDILREFMADTSSKHPGHTLLSSLDDFNQALYTSLHARGTYGLGGGKDDTLESHKEDFFKQFPANPHSA